MLDSHAHIGDIEFKKALVCSASPDEIPSGYLFNSVGVLPENDISDLSKIEEYASKGYLVGEIGLDKRYPNPDRQIDIFKRAIHIATKYDRFVTIHMVGYQEKTYEIIRQSRLSNFMIHGYTGSVEMAKRFISLGGLISLSPKSERAKSFSSLITLPFITETDMKMSTEENKTLIEWNYKLSYLLDIDVEKESEKRLLERLS